MAGLLPVYFPRCARVKQFSRRKVATDAQSTSMRCAQDTDKAALYGAGRTPVFKDAGKRPGRISKREFKSLRSAFGSAPVSR